jgi:hypothetical protein
MLHRRAQVLQLKAAGLSQQEISKQLLIDDSTVSEDLHYMQEEAKRTIKDYIVDVLPMQHKMCLAAFDNVIQRSYQIMNTTHDPRERAQMMQIFRDTHMMKMELSANSLTIDQAMGYINKSRQQLQPEDQEQEQEQEQQLEEEQEEEE